MSRRRCKRQLIKFAQHVHRMITGTLHSENEDEEQDKATEHRCPEDPERLHSQSYFTKEELQILYRGFKTGCPSGIVSEDAFKSIYAQFFPGGDSSKYAHFIFNAFDTDQNGSITFEEYARGLSILLRGSSDEKLYWAFNLYDLNKDGYISKEEMLDMMKAIYDLRGDSIPPSLKEEASHQHVDIFFQKMDRNQDGVVTVDEFMDACQKDDNIMHSIQLFESTI